MVTQEGWFGDKVAARGPPARAVPSADLPPEFQNPHWCSAANAAAVMGRLRPPGRSDMS